jgi:hypothetical protein
MSVICVIDERVGEDDSYMIDYRVTNNVSLVVKAVYIL